MNLVSDLFGTINFVQPAASYGPAAATPWAVMHVVAGNNLQTSSMPSRTHVPSPAVQRANWHWTFIFAAVTAVWQQGIGNLLCKTSYDSTVHRSL